MNVLCPVGFRWCVVVCRRVSTRKKGWARKGDGQQAPPFISSATRRKPCGVRLSHVSPHFIPSSLFSRLPLPSHTDWPPVHEWAEMMGGGGRRSDPPATHLASGLPARAAHSQTGWVRLGRLVPPGRGGSRAPKWPPSEADWQDRACSVVQFWSPFSRPSRLGVPGAARGLSWVGLLVVRWAPSVVILEPPLLLLLIPDRMNKWGVSIGEVWAFLILGLGLEWAIGGRGLWYTTQPVRGILDCMIEGTVVTRPVAWKGLGALKGWVP